MTFWVSSLAGAEHPVFYLATLIFSAFAFLSKRLGELSNLNCDLSLWTHGLYPFNTVFEYHHSKVMNST